MTDLATIVGLDADVVRGVSYKPLLVDRDETNTCFMENFSFEILEGSSSSEKEQALDLLKSMMRVSPLDRPDCDTLLKHPFFTVTPVTVSPNNNSVLKN